ncbi:CLUMA_CG010371, isoform A [Clunio marinus]|uniref:CLUMA_CG010371, isoform A n=1 Tax=Clunio marinus TaxID=568069 RepID=A0A1J1IBP2_9DIPT|nr:CLUMA_CG010371, isoform A [Clunio marinus]
MNQLNPNISTISQNSRMRPKKSALELSRNANKNGRSHLKNISGRKDAAMICMPEKNNEVTKLSKTINL